MGKDNIDKLLGFVKNAGRRHVKVQTAWVIVKSVDWDAKTMVATGVLDDLDYEDVLLGVGAEYRKPAKGSKCLIGLIENNDAATVLLHAEELELIEWNGGDNEGLVKVSVATEKLNALEKDINNLKQLFSSWVPVAQDGGAALKAAVTTWANTRLIESNKNELQNDKIKH